MKSFKASLNDARKALGTTELAKRLGMPAPSLRRCFSTGRWSDAVKGRAKKVLAKFEAQARKAKAAAKASRRAEVARERAERKAAELAKLEAERALAAAKEAEKEERKAARRRQRQREKEIEKERELAAKRDAAEKVDDAAVADAPGIEVDESELAELAELWGVSENEVEDLLACIDPDFDMMTLPDVGAYIDDMQSVLEAEGFDVEISDLWDMYYGYAPGYSRAA